ncbi:MAG: SGNH/GDSL hydrolase family protein, partial [Actinomycetota bacterium]|nr:SGNH/GDSL hydrolase family protein [Actinomycetota bacterium]
YVALGDSFTAGPGIPRQVGPDGCGRSDRNYPSVLAERLDVASFVDVSCSGAATTELRTGQRTAGDRVPPQLAALSGRTDLVTVGLGGNDFAIFGRIVTLCPVVALSDPDGAPCRRFFRAGGEDALLESVRRVRDRLTRGLRVVRARAPSAQVLVVGYPRIVPSRGTCPQVLPFATGDYRYAELVERRLNAALRAAARATGARFVDTYGPSRGHDVCAGPDAWVNGQRRTAAAAPYHPFARGMAGVAAAVQEVLTPGRG